ncbi:MAG TPA: 4-(cytidine 5'-diphospho)-2-C-methyl-D-erythritol kinase [Terriglobales bacterium]|nr:4-(cytidine 5'-diphospho)-2-C-methyl-D-erythritol kinase [Terriglobales bacterium]
MPVTVRSFAKINIGLYIGDRRLDGFHDLLTVYQTIALHDIVRVQVSRGDGLEVHASDARVPTDSSNTCWRVAERVMRKLNKSGKVTITIEKGLPVQGGLGAGSSNAVAAMFALERALRTKLALKDRFAIAAEVGSDLPLFLLGGTILGTGRGERVFPLPDLPPWPIVLALPGVAVSTPQAFADWDAHLHRPVKPNSQKTRQLTNMSASDRIAECSQSMIGWLAGSFTGVPGLAAGDRAEKQLLDLVRAGIENDFESVVFPQHPELRDVKSVLAAGGAAYASLSGSGSTVYGVFSASSRAAAAAARLTGKGTTARITRLLRRNEYCRKMFVD